MASATFGAGCFWGVEVAFGRVPGVTGTEVGYAGGKLANPSYEMVCSGQTGHAEVVQVVYDPDRVSYETLLEAFWQCHDPTQLNRQGADVGDQYRSVIFTHDPEQAAAASASKAKLQDSGRCHAPVVTEVTPLERFWPAEAYHQRYFEKRGLRHHVV